MVEFLTHIPISLFLLYFGIFSTICIIVGKLWVNAESSTQYPMPEPTRFDPIAIAALRGGWKSVIRTTIFNMWNRGLISIGMHITKTQGKYVVQSVPEQGEGLVGIERGIYQFLQERREIKYLFWNTALRTHVKKHLEPIAQDLTGGIRKCIC